jgi:hypothetical protein
MHRKDKINATERKCGSAFKRNSFESIKIIDFFLFMILFITLVAMRLGLNFWHDYLMPLFLTTIAINLIFIIIDSIGDKNV